MLQWRFFVSLSLTFPNEYYDTDKARLFVHQFGKRNERVKTTMRRERGKHETRKVKFGFMSAYDSFSRPITGNFPLLWKCVVLELCLKRFSSLHSFFRPGTHRALYAKPIYNSHRGSGRLAYNDATCRKTSGHDMHMRVDGGDFQNDI